MYSLDIALSNYMAGETVNIVQRYKYNVFDKCNCTKNRGACVEGVIWLLGVFTSQINLNDDAQIIS